VTVACSAVKIIPNAAYLGMGYNIIKGNALQTITKIPVFFSAP